MMHVGIQASHMSERQHVRMRMLHTAHKLENPRSKHKGREWSFSRAIT